ncbi:hypothetical protein SLJ66_001971 [Escherichia coli]|nr:hypothetical protein [Escherichia coli]
MKQRPIIFNEYQVRALLDGNMTQTRRIMKADCMDVCEKDDGSLWPWREDEENHGDYWYPCPFGAVGDQLYVRESFSCLESFDSTNPAVPNVFSSFWYWADGEPAWGDWTRPQSGAVMPRAASRITLEITGVRVQRLHDGCESKLLDELGAMLEYDNTPAGRAFNHAEHYAIAGVPTGLCPEMHGFRAWWDKQNGEGSFYANPWVWVIDFKRVEA